ncbi:MAG: starch-binding protein [Lachnospiraceae bacterium]|nr:starch-binding protein [Lachnospiraceae bacterium]
MKTIKRLLVVFLSVALTVVTVPFQVQINAADMFTFTFKDATPNHWLKGSADGVTALYEISSGGQTYPMTMMSNGRYWCADIPENLGAFTVNRKSEDGTSVWNSWNLNTSARGGMTVYAATGSGSGTWIEQSTPVDPVDTDYSIYGTMDTEIASHPSNNINIPQIVDTNDGDNDLIVVPAIYYNYVNEAAAGIYSDTCNWWKQFLAFDHAITKKYYGENKLRYPLYTQAADSFDTYGGISTNRKLEEMFTEDEPYDSTITDAETLFYVNHNLSAGLAQLYSPVQGLVADFLSTDRKLLSSEKSNNRNVIMPFFDDNFLGTTGDEVIKEGYWATRYGSINEPLSFPFRKQGDLYIFDSNSGIDNIRVLGDGTVTYSSAASARVSDATNDDTGFFPFNDSSNSGNSKTLKYGFGTRMDIPFTVPQTGDEIKFNFRGDDDIWVYIDGRLVLDLGGAHGNAEGEINFTTDNVYAKDAYVMDYSADKIQSASDNKVLSDLFDDELYFTDPYEEHTMTLFYMERGLYDSNLMISFNFDAKNLVQASGFNVDNHITASNVDSALRGMTKYVAEQDTFEYKILNTDNNSDEAHQILPNGVTDTSRNGSGNVANKEVLVLGQDEETINRNSIRNNKISVAQKQYDKYNTLFEIEDGDGNTIVSSSPPNYTQTDENGTWLKADDDSYRGKPGSQTVLVQNATVSDDISQSITTNVAFYNDIKVSGFSITKQYDGSQETEFTFEVGYTKLFGAVVSGSSMLTGSLNNVRYTVGGETRTVTNNCITIRAGQTAVFEGIPVDTIVTVRELYAGASFTSVTVSNSSNNAENLTFTDNTKKSATIGTSQNTPAFLYVNTRIVGDRWVYYTEVGKETSLPIPDEYQDKVTTSIPVEVELEDEEVTSYAITDNTVFFNPPDGWDTSKIYCYQWNDSVRPLGNWPGTKMNYDSQSGYYYIELGGTETQTNLIFNNGSGTNIPQTGNLTYQLGYPLKLYDASNGGTLDDTKWTFISPIRNYDLFYLPADTPYTYYYIYQTGSSNIVGEWPGRRLTMVEYDGTTYYVGIIPSGLTDPKVIFNDYNGTQSAELSFTSGKSYYYSGSALNEFTLPKRTTIEYESVNLNEWSTQANSILFEEDADPNHRAQVVWTNADPDNELSKHTLTMTSTHVGKDSFEIVLHNEDGTQKIIQVIAYNYQINDQIYVPDYGLRLNMSSGVNGLFGTSGDGYDYENNISVNNQTILDSVEDADTENFFGFSNDATGTKYKNSMYYNVSPGEFELSKQFNQALVSIDGSGNIIYTPQKFMSDVDSFSYGVQVSRSDLDNSDEKDATNSTPVMTANVKVIPANIIYYEDNFSNSGTVLADGDNGIIYSTNRTSGEDAQNYQSGDNLEQFGHDSSYERTGEFSQGISHVLNNGDTAIFAFKGTGFDINSRTNYATGILQATVYDREKVIIEDGKVKAKPGMGFSCIEKTILVNTYYQNGDLYQVPVISFRSDSLEAKEYVVKLSAGGDNKIIYIDGIRIYNPITDYNADVEEAYSLIGENDAIKDEVKSLILGNAEYGTNYTEIAGDESEIIARLGNPKVSIIDYSTNSLTVGKTVVEAFTSYSESGGTPSTISDLITYAQAGPNHELYLSNDYGIAFVASSLSDTNSTLQIGAKKVTAEGSVTLKYLKSDNSWGDVATINSSSENYYKLDDFLSEMPVDISGHPKVVLRVVSTNNALLSMTYLKYNNFSIKVLEEGINTEVDEAKIELTGENMGGSFNRRTQQYEAGVTASITLTTTEDCYDVKLKVKGSEVSAIKRCEENDGTYTWTLSFKTQEVWNMSDIEVYTYTIK